jgi:SPP1 family predicted phage head-tail adaptor
MDAGKLRHRVALQYQAQSQDADTGEITVSWQTLATVWAAIEPLSTREFIQSQAVQSEVTTRITIRKRNDVTAACRAVHMVNGVAGKVYNILGALADPVSGLEYQTLPCSEGVNQGGA